MNLKDPFNNKKNPMSYLLKNGKLINIKEKRIQEMDLLLENKKIISLDNFLKLFL